jgi:hypothetical protein
MGLEPYSPITSQHGALTIAWPYPQVFTDKFLNYICTQTKIYYYYPGWTQNLAITTTGDSIWDLVPYGHYVLFVNGTKIVERNGVTGGWTAVNSSTTMPRFATACDFNGQVIGGNVKTTWHSCGVNSVVWSGIGNVDFTPGGDNEAGYKTLMHWNGNVLRVRKLGDAVVVYGDNGIALMTPYQQTFGWKRLADFGIAWKGAIGGDEKKHVFVAGDGTLYGIDASNYQIQELGYKEYISLIDLTEVMVSYDPLLDEFYICDDDYSYLLTKWGLCSMYQRVTSVFPKDGAVYGVSSDASGATDDEARVTTDTIDFGLRGLKTLNTMEVGIYHPLGSTYYAYGSVDWRITKEAAFQTRTWQLMNPQGVVTPLVTAEEFRLKVKVDNYASVQIDSITPRMKLVDKRFVRGIYSAR